MSMTNIVTCDNDILIRVPWVNTNLIEIINQRTIFTTRTLKIKRQIFKLLLYRLST